MDPYFQCWFGKLQVSTLIDERDSWTQTGLWRQTVASLWGLTDAAASAVKAIHTFYQQFLAASTLGLFMREKINSISHTCFNLLLMYHEISISVFFLCCGCILKYFSILAYFFFLVSVFWMDWWHLCRGMSAGWCFALQRQGKAVAEKHLGAALYVSFSVKKCKNLPATDGVCVCLCACAMLNSKPT